MSKENLIEKVVFNILASLAAALAMMLLLFCIVVMSRLLIGIFTDSIRFQPNQAQTSLVVESGKLNANKGQKQ